MPKYVAVIVYNGGKSWHTLSDTDTVILVEPEALYSAFGGDASTLQEQAVLTQRIITGMVQPIKDYAVKEA